MFIDVNSRQSYEAQYKRWARRGLDPVFAPLPVITDSYDEYVEVVEAVGHPQNLAWQPRDAGHALTNAGGDVALHHLIIGSPNQPVDASLNSTRNMRSLVSLAVRDHSARTPAPFRLSPEWSSGLRSLALTGDVYPDPAWLRSLSSLEHLHLTVSRFDCRDLPQRLRYLSIQDSDIEYPEALNDVLSLRALRIVASRGIADAQQLRLGGLDQLEFLKLDGFTKTASLGFLESAQQIRVLSISGMNRVSDLSPLATLPKLEFLHIGHNSLGAAELEEVKHILSRPGFQTLVGFNGADFEAMGPDMQRKIHETAPPAWVEETPFPLRTMLLPL